MPRSRPARLAALTRVESFHNSNPRQRHLTGRHALSEFSLRSRRRSPGLKQARLASMQAMLKRARVRSKFGPLARRFGPSSEKACPGLRMERLEKQNFGTAALLDGSQVYLEFGEKCLPTAPVGSIASNTASPHISRAVAEPDPRPLLQNWRLGTSFWHQ